MSWGFFCDFEVTLPTKDFQRVWKSKASEHALPTPLIGFKSKELEETFTWNASHDPDDQPDVALKDIEKYVKWQNGRSTKTTANGETTLRGCMCLDRGGDPHHAKVAAIFLHAARATGRGHVALVNDGSYAGADGIVLVLRDGVIHRTPIADCRPLGRVLGPALWEGADLPSAEVVVALASGNELPSTPKKATPKKAAPKKAAPKKAAPKKATPKKATPKKAAPKKATPKKATPKRRAMKKPAAKLPAVAATRAGPKKGGPKKR